MYIVIFLIVIFYIVIFFILIFCIVIFYIVHLLYRHLLYRSSSLLSLVNISINTALTRPTVSFGSGQYLSLETVQALQQPLESDIAAVRAHIKRAGGVEVSSSAATDKIIADVPLDFVQTELTELFVHCDIVSGLPRTEASVQRIAMEKEAKTIKLKHRQPKGTVGDSTDPQSCLADRAVPPCIRKAYGIENEVSKTGNGNSQAVIVNQGYKQSDLNAFCSEYKLKDCPKSVTNVGKYVNEAGDEATLDVQYSTATGQVGFHFVS